MNDVEDFPTTESSDVVYIELDVGPEGEEQRTRIITGGDRAAGHTLFGLDSCIHLGRDICMPRCLAKPEWTQAPAKRQCATRCPSSRRVTGT